MWDSVTGNAGDLHVQDPWAAVEASVKMPLKNGITGKNRVKTKKERFGDLSTKIRKGGKKEAGSIFSM